MRSKSLAPPSIGRSWHEGQVRTPQTAVDRGRDRQAPHAREKGRGIESHRQGADPQRGIGEGARQGRRPLDREAALRSEEHTSELQSLMRISYAVFCLKKKNNENRHKH